MLIPFLLPLALSTQAVANGYVWLEGEKPIEASAPFETTSCNFPQLLSDGKWLTLSKKKEELPPEGFVLSYRFTGKSGSFDVKARVGFEWVRSSFDWRLNDGPWTEAPAGKPTKDPVRLATWMEAGWLDLGSAPLRAGENALQLRYKPKADGSVLAALDAIALVPVGTRLEGTLRPGSQPGEDQDRQAAAKVYSLPAVDAVGRVSVRLDGLWQVARWDDPDPDTNPYDPVPSLPRESLNWYGVQVPGDAWNAKPELGFASRLVYRTRVDVTAGHKSYFLHFSGTNWIASVFANGKYMGGHQGTLVPWDLDVTKGIEPGKVNEIAVVVKGPYYARDVDGKGENDLLHTRNLPREEGFLKYARWVAPIYPSTKGEGDGTAIGLVNPVSLTATGPAYVSDVFVRSRTAQTKLVEADIELTNPGPDPQVAGTKVEIVDAASNEVVTSWTGPSFDLKPGESKTVSTGHGFAAGKLWWPVRNPSMYVLRTTVLSNGSPIDIHNQPFGFREITTQGRRILINGVVRNFWNWVDITGATNPAEWLAKYEAGNDRFHRFAYDHRVPGVEPHREAQLEWSDRNGVPGRLSTCIDGMFITYDLNKPLVWQNFRQHLEQVAKAYRNHPSVIVHSAENELMYINAQNTGQADMAEPKMVEIIRAAEKIDPTRPWMVDGGGSLHGQLAIDCPHYPEGDTQYQPENAYSFFEYANHSKRWPWDRQRPIILGETFFYAGKLEDQAWIGGDEVFRGRQFANRGAAKYARMLNEGFRWQEVAGICPWVGVDSLPGAEKSFSSLAVFPRKRAPRLVGGKTNPLLVKVFNDTFSQRPVKFEWALEVGGKVQDRGSTELSITPGLGQEQTWKLTPKAVRTRQAGQLRVKASQDGVVGFEDSLSVSILPGVSRAKTTAPLLVFDRSGKLGPWLASRGYQAEALSDLAALTNKRGLLMVGPDTLKPEEAYSSVLLGFAGRGNGVVVLEQETPVAGAGLPIALRTSSKVGGYAFSQAPTSAVMRNLGDGDLEDWAGDFPTFKKAYIKPPGGARCLVQAGEGLNYAPLLEVPAGKGVLVLCQLRVGAKLGIEAAADQLFTNLIETYSSFKPASGKVAVVAIGTSSISKAIGKSSVLSSPASLQKALDPSNKVAVVQATKENLASLIKEKGSVERFAANGGWLMLTNLTADGLPEFNKLVGIEEMIRPFRVERVTLEHPDHPLASTLGNRDLAFYSPVEIMHGDYWLSEHVFSHVLGAEDAAPFFRMPGGPEDPLEYKPTFSDNDPFNYVNGLLNSDSWRTIRQLWVPEQGELALDFGARRPEVLRQINVWNNVNYSTIERMQIVFDGDTATAMEVTLPDSGELTEIKLDPPRAVGKSIRFVVKSWRRPFQVRDGQVLRLVGLDNVQFLRANQPKGRIALDNVGGLVAYPRGKGGIFLSQLKFDEGDPNPANAEKKLRLLTTLLGNMGAGSASAEVVVPGVNAEFGPIDLTRANNVYIRNRDGQRDLFGDGLDLKHLVAGESFFGDLPFLITNYATAPVPQAITVGHRGKSDQSEPIELGRAADVLYFLHTANILRAVQEWEGKDLHPEVARYQVEYADGSVAEIPVRMGEEVAHWRVQGEPSALPNGLIAWSVPYPGAAPDHDRPVLYASSWTNPRPGLRIERVRMIKGKDGERAQVMLLGLTAASVRR